METLRLGSRGDLVRQLEQLLVVEGYPLKQDALFDQETEDAVRNYQTRMGLVPDGLAGSKTISTLLARAKNAKFLTMAEIQTGATLLGVEVEAILAINEVESRGTGFLPDGRPVILYERHIMHRQLAARDINPVAIAAVNPIVNARPGGYKGGSAEYMRLAAAKQINHEAALESCSYGAYQIMGFHWKRLGYASVQELVEKMSHSEDEQFLAFTRFIKTDSALHKALKAKKWADFARLYNGPNYAINLYDIKLERAYARYQSHNLKAAA